MGQTLFFPSITASALVVNALRVRLNPHKRHPDGQKRARGGHYLGPRGDSLTGVMRAAPPGSKRSRGPL